MRIYAIDPGPVQSALVEYDCVANLPVEGSIRDNMALLEHLGQADGVAMLVVEMIASYGMPVGKTTFETCVWIGRFMQAFWERSGTQVERLYRMDVKMAICHNSRAKDSNVRQALLDRFPATGGGKTPQVGTKKQPGPLYGFKADMWAALGVAVAWNDLRGGA